MAVFRRQIWTLFDPKSVVPGEYRRPLVRGEKESTFCFVTAANFVASSLRFLPRMSCLSVFMKVGEASVVRVFRRAVDEKGCSPQGLASLPGPCRGRRSFSG